MTDRGSGNMRGGRARNQKKGAIVRVFIITEATQKDQKGMGRRNNKKKKMKALESQSGKIHHECLNSKCEGGAGVLKRPSVHVAKAQRLVPKRLLA